MDDDPFSAVWRLVPELCLYEEGEPPLTGTYTIRLTGDEVTISIEWLGVDEQQHQVQFGGPTDGTLNESDSDASRGVTHFSMTRMGPSILDSRAFVNDEEVSYARRCVSEDGQLLTSVQQGRRADGSSFRNFQVYRRGD